MFEKRLYTQKFTFDKSTNKLISVSQIDLSTALLDLDVARLNKVYGEDNNLEVIKDAFAFDKDNKRMIYIYMGELN